MRLPLTCLTALLVFAPAHAETTEPVATEISYTLEQLATAPGANDVFEMIQDVARQTCRLPLPGKLSSTVVDQACVQEIVENAVTQINAPNLTLAYQQATGQRVELEKN